MRARSIRQPYAELILRGIKTIGHGKGDILDVTFSVTPMMFVLVYNLIRATMVMAADHQGVDPRRVSFIDAMRRLCSLCNRLPVMVPVDLVVNPRRRGRWHPRVIKRRKTKYPLMTKPRSEYSEPATGDAVMI